MEKIITLDFSCPIKNPHFDFPRILKYAKEKNEELIKLLPYKYTRNQHRLTYKIASTRVELLAWLSLFLSYYPEAAPELKAMEEEIERCEREGYTKNQFGSYQITLSNLKRHCVKTNVLQRWFYPDM